MSLNFMNGGGQI